VNKDSRNKSNRSRAIRRLAIWYRRNSAVTSIVDTATNSATTATNVAGSVVSSAGSVVSSAGSVVSSAGSKAFNTLQPLVFDPLKRLQIGDSALVKDTIDDSKRVWIAVDGMGGDYAPGPILEGCLKAIERLPVKIKFVGEINKIQDAAKKENLSEWLTAEVDSGRLELVSSGPSVLMNDEPTAVRKKRDASINIAMNLVKENKASAIYSAGNSGAFMASAIFRLGRLSGIDRPAIGALFPTKDPSSPVLVLDVGANTDCKPNYLHQFALLGNIYSRDVLQVNNPRIGLLNIGEESCKGNDLSQKTYELLSKENSFNFVGNCEGRDVLSGDFDVVVCDGFTGNVLLKFLESVGGVLLDILRSELPRGRRGKVGSAFLRSNLKRIKKRLDHAEHGGALLLGVNGVCVIGHGSSKSLSVVSALRIAHSAVAHGVMEDLLKLQKLPVLTS
tara:strand:- start:1394 stop:2734 length:1341 start_codon:yes stop_codon:yes gene_type:complete